MLGQDDCVANSWENGPLGFRVWGLRLGFKGLGPGNVTPSLKGNPTQQLLL